MTFNPKRAHETTISIALSDALAATRRAFIPLGLVVTALALVPLVGLLIVTPLLITAALRDLRDGHPHYVGETFSAFGSRIGEFLTTWLVTLLLGIAAVVAFVITLLGVGLAALLGAGSAPGASAGAELLLGVGVVALFVGVVLYMGLRFSFIYYAAFDGKGAVEAFRYSWTLSAGSVLRILGWGLVSGLVGVLITISALLVGGLLSIFVPLLGALLGLLALAAGSTAGLMVGTRMLAILYLARIAAQPRTPKK